MGEIASTEWPPLPYAEWEPTKQTLHRYAQIIGKIRMALAPPRNHWWHVTLYLATRGFTTGPMPYGDRYVEIVLDLLDHRIRVISGDGREKGVDLIDRPACADVYHALFGALSALDVSVEIHPEPFDLGDSLPFAQDRRHDTYDPDAVTRFWRVAASTERALAQFQSRFSGKASPVHLFWLIALRDRSPCCPTTRYTGRPTHRTPCSPSMSTQIWPARTPPAGTWSTSHAGLHDDRRAVASRRRIAAGASGRRRLRGPARQSARGFGL